MTPRTLSPVTTRVATAADAALLASLAGTAFSDSFAADNTPENMALYMAKSFGEEIQREELNDPRHIVFFAEREGEVVGYAMMHDGTAPDSVASANAMEIVRFYAVKRLIGSGIGATLMQRCLDEAVSRGKNTVWLAVWSRNPRAIAFYGRWGFVNVGSQTFVLGHDRQTDDIMARRVGEEV
ncbi:MAG: GNAT family N-acetyltransferase [bacterium]